MRIVDGDPDDDGDVDPPDGTDQNTATLLDTATIYVYDAIGAFDGVEASTMVKNIAAIQKANIHVRINSPGGDVFDARAIKTALEQHPAKVTAYIDGVAASAASFLMLGADDIQIAPGAFIMIHNPWGFAMGDAKEMRATATLLDQVGAAICKDYAAKTGLDAATIAQMMEDETWLSAEDAVAKGFCNSIMVRPPKTKNSKRRAFNLSAYAHPPQTLAAQAEDEAKAFAELEAAREQQIQRLNTLFR